MSDESVHTTHCCPRHGCKYSDENCPVENHVAECVYPKHNGCEMCEGEQNLHETNFPSPYN